MSNAVPVEAWGRKTQATWTTAFWSLVLVIVCPLWIITNWIALEYFGGSLQATVQAFFTEGPYLFFIEYAPQPTTRAFAGYGAWVLLQALFYSYLSGPLCTGQLTPAGNLLKYTTNGLLAYAITHILYIASSAVGVLDPAIIARNWEGLLVAINAYGMLLSAFAQVKAHVSPSYPGDRKFSGECI